MTLEQEECKAESFEHKQLVLLCTGIGWAQKEQPVVKLVAQ